MSARLLVDLLRDPSGAALLDVWAWNGVISAARAERLLGTLAVWLEGIGVPPEVNSILAEAKLDAEIDTYRDMINDRQLEGSLALLKKLLHREEATASGRILFRIKANIGAAHLNLGHEVPATDWLLAAYDHAPMEPKAIANKALAHLLRGEWDEVLRMGRENLTSEAADDSLSSHVIQAARFAGITLRGRTRLMYLTTAVPGMSSSRKVPSASAATVMKEIRVPCSSRLP